MKHTQGKWEVGFAYQDHRDPTFYHVDIICNGTLRVAVSSGVGKDLAESNARLIAAAPDLLAVVKDVVKHPHCLSCELKARKAIAEAKG